MELTQEQIKEAEEEFDRWKKEKIVDLRKKCGSKELEILKKLDVQYRSPRCSEYEFRILLGKVYDYYDFEKLMRKEELNYKEKEILENFLDEQEMKKEWEDEGYTTSVEIQKKLEDTGVSEEEYKELLIKLENIYLEIKVQKKIRRIEKKLEKVVSIIENDEHTRKI